MSNKTASFGNPDLKASRGLESGMNDSATVIQKLLHNTCNCPRSITLESALIGLSDEIGELLDEAYPLRPSSDLFKFFSETRTIVEGTRIQYMYGGIVNYDELIKQLANLEIVITNLSELNYQLKELHDVSMMLAWVYHFLAGKDDKYNQLLERRFDVTPYYLKAMHRFKLTGCIRSPRHHTSCRENSSEWPLIANPLIAPL